MGIIDRFDYGDLVNVYPAAYMFDLSARDAEKIEPCQASDIYSF